MAGAVAVADWRQAAVKERKRAADLAAKICADL
jgi:hypothetical protein